MKFTDKIEFNDYIVSCKGLLFIDDKKAGTDSIKYFFNKYKDNYLNNLEELNGNYVIEISYKKQNKKIIFTDNSGMYRLYYEGDKYFDNYLEHIKKNKTKKDIDMQGMVEFLQFGYGIFHTFIKNVNILQKYEYIEINSKFEIKKKQLNDLSYKGTDIIKFYNNFNSNFKNMKIACDLTAGTDSRLNASLLKYNCVPFKTSIMGNKDHIDVIKCDEISKVLDVEQCNYKMNEKMDLKSFEEIFTSLDGQYSVLEYYKNYILRKNLISDNFDLRISGAGGEMYKYSLFAQDFPFFHKKNFSLDKLYQIRFNTKPIKYQIYTESFNKEILKYQNEFKKKLEKYRLKTNSKTYDNICYDIIMRYGASTQMINNDYKLFRYCPLLELKIVRNGFNLSVFDRLVYKYHRNVITKCNEDVSKIKTNKGLNINNNFTYIFKDIIKLFNEFVGKVYNKLRHKKIYKYDTANSVNIFDQFKKVDQDMIKILVENKIISTIDGIDNNTYSRLMTIAYYLKELK